MAVKIFFCYAHEDKKMLNELKKHLIPFQKVGAVEIWHDADISAGVEWEPEIAKHLNSAHIILLLISADFMASDYCYGTELKWAIERHKLKEARVIPVILRPVYWKTVESLKKLQALPTDGKAVTTWPNIDSAYEHISEGIAAVIKELSIHEPLKASEQPQQEHLKTEVKDALSSIPETPKTSVTLRRKKALLVLTGGRALPDILTFLYLQPQLVVIIAPQEGWSFEQTFVEIVKTLPDCTLSIIRNVDAFDIEASMQACLEVYLQFPDMEWTITTSSSTKIMGLAGYEFAKQKGIPCVQVDVLREKVISLVQKIEVDEQRFFHLTIDEYVKNYGYTTVNNRWSSSNYENKGTPIGYGG